MPTAAPLKLVLRQADRLCFFKVSMCFGSLRKIESSQPYWTLTLGSVEVVIMGDSICEKHLSLVSFAFNLCRDRVTLRLLLVYG